MYKVGKEEGTWVNSIFDNSNSISASVGSFCLQSNDSLSLRSNSTCDSRALTHVSVSTLSLRSNSTCDSRALTYDSLYLYDFGDIRAMVYWRMEDMAVGIIIWLRLAATDIKGQQNWVLLPMTRAEDLLMVARAIGDELRDAMQNKQQ